MSHSVQRFYNNSRLNLLGDEEKKWSETEEKYLFDKFNYVRVLSEYTRNTKRCLMVV